MSPTAGSLILTLVLGSAAAWQVAAPPRLSTPGPAYKDVSTRAELESIRSWGDGTVELIRPGTDGKPGETRRVQAKSIHYHRPDVVETFLSLVADPYTNLTYLTQFGQAFYVSDSNDLIACQIGGSALRVRRSVSKRAGPFTTDQDALTALLTSVDDKQLLERSRASVLINLAPGTPREFWTHPTGSSQPVNPTIVGVDVSDFTVRLELLSAGDRFRGTFWIDLAAGKLLKTSIEGR